MICLQRIEDMQKELAAKLDTVANCSSFVGFRDTGLAVKVPESFASVEIDERQEVSENRLFENDSQQEAVEKAARRSSVKARMKKANTWQDDEEDDKKAKETDLDALGEAMGWRNSMTGVFNVNDSDDCLTRFAMGPIWAALSVAVIVINTIFIGCELQFSTMHHLETALNQEGNWWGTPGTYDDRVFDVTEKVFLAWMIFEVLVNAYAQKKNFLFGRDKYWNFFDLLVLTLSLAMQFLTSTSVSFLRVARLFRLGKILRVFKVFKFLRGIRSMMISITGSVMHLLSAMLIMSIFMYTVALFIMQGISAEAFTEGMLQGTTNTSGRNPRSLEMFSSTMNDDTTVQQVYLLYGSIQRSMLTLFMTISGGLEWRIAALPMAQLGWHYGVLWLAYIAFMVLGMLNVLTGIFVDAAFQAMANDRHNIIQSQLEERSSVINMIRGIFEDSDTDGSGHVTFEEFEQLLANQEMVAYLQAMGIDGSEAKGLFKLLDDDGSGVVSIDEFITGFLRLKGGAKAVDMVTLLYENRKISKKLHRIFKEARNANINLSHIRATEGALSSNMGSL